MQKVNKTYIGERGENYMKIFKKYFVTLAILLIITLSITGCNVGPNIVKAIDGKYPLKSATGDIRIYKSDADVNDTVNNIVVLKNPYDKKVDENGKSILLYDEAVLIISEQNNETEIELVKDHETAYNRHRNTMIMFWGGNVFSRGRIRTPRSIRRGSVGSPSTRGGGFSFGK